MKLDHRVHFTHSLTENSAGEKGYAGSEALPGFRDERLQI